MRKKNEIMQDVTKQYQQKIGSLVLPPNNYVDFGQQLLIEVLVDIRDLLKVKAKK